MSSRIVATLFEIWLIACNKVFPSPSLWKTFQELCANWRHHISLVVEWNRVCLALTHRLLELIWWPPPPPPPPPQSSSSSSPSSSPSSSIASSAPTAASGGASCSLITNNAAYDIQTIIGQMNTEVVSQAWFRFLNIIGKPVDFGDLNVSVKFKCKSSQLIIVKLNN